MGKYYYIKIIMHIALNLSYETKLRLWLVATKNGSSCKEAGHWNNNILLAKLSTKNSNMNSCFVGRKSAISDSNVS